MKKKVIITLVIIGSIYISILLVDIINIKVFNSPPVFAKLTMQVKCPGGARVYYGLGYKIIECNRQTGEKNFYIGSYNLQDKCNCWTITPKPDDYIIVNETEICADALEEIYSDEKYIYYLPCISSANIYVKYNNGNKINIKDVLEQKLLTIDELIEKGLQVHKYEI
jgi:hypothetical protein